MIPGSGRPPGEGNSNPLQYSCQENPMDRGVWWATVHGVAKKPNSTWRLNNSNRLRWWARFQDHWIGMLLYKQTFQILPGASYLKLGSPSFSSQVSTDSQSLQHIMHAKTIQIFLQHALYSPHSSLYFPLLISSSTCL